MMLPNINHTSKERNIISLTNRSVRSLTVNPISYGRRTLGRNLSKLKMAISHYKSTINLNLGKEDETY